MTKPRPDHVVACIRSRLDRARRLRIRPRARRTRKFRRHRARIRNDDHRLLSTGDLSDVAALVSLSTDMLGIHAHRHRAIRATPRRMARDQTHPPMSSVPSWRSRSGTVTLDAYSVGPEQHATTRLCRWRHEQRRFRLVRGRVHPRYANPCELLRRPSIRTHE